MTNLVLSPLPHDDQPVEIVERKGLGHPDSICDALAETLSRRINEIVSHELEGIGALVERFVAGTINLF